MRAVNLLPTDRASGASREVFRSAIVLPVMGVVAAGAIAGLAIAVWTTNTGVSSKQQQLNALQAKIAKLPKQPIVTSAASSAVPTRKSTVISLVDARLPWDEFLGTFSRVVPENVWLSSLQATSAGAAVTVGAEVAAASASTSASSSTSTPAPAAASPSPGTFTISGYTYSQPSVARLMRRLALIPWLSDVALVSSSDTTLGQASVTQFTLSATVLPQPGGAS